MKKIVTLLTSMALALSLAACGGQQPGTTEPDNTPTEPNTSVSQSENNALEIVEQESSGTETTEPNETETEPTSGGKTLVVYYSATGTTEGVAASIAQALDADTFALEPVEPYTSADLDWRDSNSRVSREHDDESLRTVELTAATVENWEEYDTVFIGYPIWWYIASWPVNQFVQTNDFTGKTVIPFCTSSSSGLGESGTLLEEMAGTGTWLEGQRFSGRDGDETIQAWALGLGL